MPSSAPASSAPPAGPSQPSARIRQLVAEALPEAVRIRHDLHAHPELAYQEKRTSGVVVAELTRLGIKHRAGMAGGTGVLGHIPASTPEGNRKGSIAFRADMDALPILENTGASYASTTPGVMHACGHDGHTANLLGLARVLSKLEHRPRPVTLIFQPAEEGGAGGKRMCEDGCLAGEGKGGLGTPVERIFGLHGWPQYDVGQVGSRPGPLLASTDSFDVKIIGTQSHAAYPHQSADPIVATAQIITALQTIASRNLPPVESIVVTVAMINAGTARNIIPAAVTFIGTMRTLKPEIRKLGRERFHTIVQSTAAAFGCRAEIKWEEGYPVTVNDAGATRIFMETARRTLGDARVQEVEHPSLGGEDFSYYGHHVPACFFILGMRPKGRATYPSLHQPEYDFNDEALATGMETMCALAVGE